MHSCARDQTYLLYGAYASYYTAKTRSYLRKKGIPFVERLPSHPRFRDYVRPAAQSRRIPMLEAPDGTVVQDTTEIFEYLEPRFPEIPALPPGPRQRLAAYLVDLFASENTKIAWHYRWNFPEQNSRFITMDFGRSFRPQGSNEELAHYGNLIARQMDGHRARLGITDDLYPVMQDIYFDMLELLESIFTVQPYLLGGLPSVADYALMGPLFAHLGRDPYPRLLMQQRSPRVFRWTEHMLTPEIQSPEFSETAMSYLPDDEVPEMLLLLLRQFAKDFLPIYLASANRFADWVANNPNLPAGSAISEDNEQPDLGQITVVLRGHTMTCGSQIHSLWLLQRMLKWVRALGPRERDICTTFASENGFGDLLSLDLVRPLGRVRNRLVVNVRNGT